MDAHGWILALPGPAVTLAGKSSQIVFGLIGTQGGVQMVARVGEKGETVIIPGFESGGELITIIRKVMDEKYRLDRERDQ